MFEAFSSASHAFFYNRLRRVNFLGHPGHAFAKVALALLLSPLYSLQMLSKSAGLMKDGLGSHRNQRINELY